MSKRRDPDAVPTFFLGLIALCGVGGLALLPPDQLPAEIHPALAGFTLKSFALIGVAGLACAAAARAWPRYMIRFGEAQRLLLTFASGMALCFLGVIGLGFGSLDGKGVVLPPLPAIAGPLTCLAAFVLLGLRQREARRLRQLALRR